MDELGNMREREILGVWGKLEFAIFEGSLRRLGGSDGLLGDSAWFGVDGVVGQ